MYIYEFKLFNGGFDFEYVKPFYPKGIQVVAPPDMTGIRVYGVTPGEQVETGGGGGGTMPWVKRTPQVSVQQAIEIRKDVQHIMDLMSLLVLTWILDE